MKDTLEKATEPTLNLRNYLQDAYIHPVFKGELIKARVVDDEEDASLVLTKRSQRGSKTQSDASSEVGVTII